MYYVDRNLNIVGSEPRQGYQFKHEDYSECEVYVNNSKTTFTEDEIKANERKFVEETGGQKLLNSIYGEDAAAKRKKYDEKWDRIRRSRNKRNK